VLLSQEFVSGDVAGAGTVPVNENVHGVISGIILKAGTCPWRFSW